MRALTVPPPSSGDNPNVSSSFAFDRGFDLPGASDVQQLRKLWRAERTAAIAIDFDADPGRSADRLGSADGHSLNAASATQTIHLIATGVAASTNATVTSSLNPSVYRQSVTFTATIAPTTGTAVPTGTVQFSVDGTAVGAPVTLNAGVATYATATLAVGAHTVSAVYTPDSTSFTGSNGSVSQTVNKIGTTTTVASSVNPSAFMQSVTFTATVAQTAGTTVPTGTVQFSVDGVSQGGPVALSGGVGTFHDQHAGGGPAYDHRSLYAGHE